MKQWLILITLIILISSFASASLTDGLISYYSFEGNANDNTSTGNNGTVVSISQVTGIQGNAYEYIDNADYISYTSDWTNDAVDNNFSISLWARTDDVAGGGTGKVIWNQNTANGNREWTLSYLTNYLRLARFTGSGTNANYYTSTEALTEGAWHHIVMVYNESDDKVTFYINESKETLSLANGNAGVGLGVGFSKSDNAIWYMNGIIDEAGIWDRTLSTTEVSQLYTTFYPFTAPPVTKPVNVTAKDWINNTAISTFNITINEVNYTTTNGTINTEFFTNSTVLFNITYYAEDFTTITYNNLNITTGNYDGLLTSSINIFVNFYAYDNNNDSMGSPRYDIQTSTGSTSNTGNPTQVNLLEFINSTSQTMNITVNITDNLNLMQSYTNTYIINRTTRRINSTLDANQLILYFENEDGSLTNVYVQIESGNYSWNQTTNNYTFYQENLSIGNVYVKIAKDNSSNTFTQFFEYYNDYSTHIIENITIFNTLLATNFSMIIIDNNNIKVKDATVKLFQVKPSSIGEENLFLGQKLSTNDNPITFYKGIQNVRFEITKDGHTPLPTSSYGIETLIFHPYTNPLEFTLVGGGIAQLKGLTIIIPKYTKNKSINIPVYIHSPTSSNIQIITNYMDSTGQARLGLILTENNDMYNTSLISGTHFSSGTGNVTISIYKDGVYHSEFIVFDKVNELGQNLFEKPSGIDEKILLIIMVIGIILASGFISTQVDHEDAGIFAFYSLALIMTLINGTFIWTIIIPAIMLLGNKLLGLGGDQL